MEVRKPPTLDGKVDTVNATDPWKVDVVDEPSTGWPADPHLKLKGVELTDGTNFTRASAKITFLQPISIYATIQLFDGASEVWAWTAAGGDTVGG
jgi:hypothetical protein